MRITDHTAEHPVFASEDAERLEPSSQSTPFILAAPQSKTSRPELLQEFYRTLVERAEGASPADEAEIRCVLAAIASYNRWADTEFNVAHDHFRLLGEDNFRRYLPVEPLRIRVASDDTLTEILCRAAAAGAVGSRAIISSPPSLSGIAANAVALLEDLTHSWAGAIEFIEEDDESLASAITAGQVARIRYADPNRVPEPIRLAAATGLQYIADTPVSRHGRVELLWYVREQSVSNIYHRYGNLGLRADEPRDEPL
jgi:RHH-type proline utilization regulon transcriptional repressor/proline dehydrogenase/delta 1-pyrroline-5-carboxylate dehydrogenase